MTNKLRGAATTVLKDFLVGLIFVGGAALGLATVAAAVVVLWWFLENHPALSSIVMMLFFIYFLGACFRASQEEDLTSTDENGMV